MKKYSRFKSIAVYCGSSTGNDPAFSIACAAIAQEMCKREITMIYGAGNSGLMGIMADEMLKLGGNVIGVIPKRLVEYELCHENLSELIITETMHERKNKMIELADAFIALPGSIGTLEEIFEVMTLTQLGYQNKPCAALNVNGFYNELDAMIDKLINAGFMLSEHKSLLSIEKDASILFDKLEQSDFVFVDKWNLLKQPLLD